jgi:hypothetical protein
VTANLPTPSTREMIRIITRRTYTTSPSPISRFFQQVKQELTKDPRSKRDLENIARKRKEVLESEGYKGFVENVERGKGGMKKVVKAAGNCLSNWKEEETDSRNV